MDGYVVKIPAIGRFYQRFSYNCEILVAGTVCYSFLHGLERSRLYLNWFSGDSYLEICLRKAKCNQSDAR